MVTITVEVDEDTAAFLRLWERRYDESPGTVVARTLQRTRELAALYLSEPQIEADAERLAATLGRARQRRERQQSRQ